MARLIAIDPGSDAVTVTVLSGGGDDAAVEAEHVEYVPHEPGARVPLADRLAALDRILRRAPDLAGGAHHAAIAWPSEDASMHRVELPFDQDDQIAQTLPFALEAEVPYDLDTMHVAWTSEGGGRVRATVVPSSSLRELLDGLRARGLDPRVALTSGEALARWADAPDTLEAVIEVGLGAVTIVAARGGVPLAARAIATRGEDIIRSVSHALGASTRDARTLLGIGVGAEEIEEADAAFDDGFDLDMPSDEEDTAVEAVVEGLAGFDVPQAADPSGAFDPPPVPGAPVRAGATAVPAGERTDDVRDDAWTDPSVEVAATGGGLPARALGPLHAAIAQLIAEVRATLVAFEDALGEGVDGIVLTGALAHIPGLRAALVDDLDLAVRDVHDRFGPVPGDRATARGLAWRLAGDTEGTTNLRTGDFAFRGGLDLYQVLTYGGVGLALFLSAILVLFGYQVVSYRQRAADVDQRVLAMVGDVIDLPASMGASQAASLLSEVVYDNEERVAFLGDDGAAPPTVELLYTLTAGFPPHPDVTVKIDSLVVNPEKVLIDGSTDGFGQVDRIGESLSSLKRFGAIESTPGNRGRDGKLGFKVTILRDPSAVADAEEG